MSESSRDIVKCTARVWRLIKKQEELFRSVMGLEISAALRKTCSNGFMISLLYKKEMGALYESVKCNLNDGDLASITRSKNDDSMDADNLAGLLSDLIRGEQQLISAYELLLSHIDEDSEAALACHAHISQLASLSHTLAAELTEFSDDTQDAYTSVA
ncbi:hypothetical protein [Dyadobacter sp. Leaf189]|uniref:hypothetical protein n=1 Tax=Dyadobacter sp. Leaf189 TaxID=1736295 RepID=UPI0006F41588|nr:hypothetical protein [Dyadobacter sp. Leaf189]KQS30945.1 hypothetical protein ASG33_11315 [Dyadobacter sp. Leaf189]